MDEDNVITKATALALPSHSHGVHRSEVTPLLASESKPICCQYDDCDFDHEKSDKTDGISPKNSDDMPRDEFFFSFLSHSSRSPCNRPILPIIVTMLCLLSSLGFLGASFDSHHLLSSMTAILYSPDIVGDDNPSRIESLRESLGSSMDNLQNAAVASDHPVCSRVGTNILQKGGNAVDAAVATVLCLGVASPASSGLGGGAFLLIRSNRTHLEENLRLETSMPAFVDSRVPQDGVECSDFVTEVIDCRETAPEHSTQNMYAGKPKYASLTGGLAISVPGELRGLELAHARHGKLPWSAVVKPSILLARNGVKVNRHIATFIEGLFTKWFAIMQNDGSSINLSGIKKYLSTAKFDNNGHALPPEYLKEGDILRNLPLAQTLQKIAENGADAFYTGEIAENLVRDVQDNGGILTLNDLKSYRAILRTPIIVNVSDYTLVGVPPPSSGGAVVIGIARFLSGYATPFAAHADDLSVHRMVEGMRHAFAIRMSLSDPAYNTNLTQDAVRDLTATGYMESLREMTLDNSVLSLSHYGGPKWAMLQDSDGTAEAHDAHEGDRRLFQTSKTTDIDTSQNIDNSDLHRRRLVRPFGYLEDSGTSHLSVVDKDGNAVAVTSSINGIFGSNVYSEKTGVVLGNTMDDFGSPLEASNVFGLKPSEANFIAPGKRVSKNLK